MKNFYEEGRLIISPDSSGYAAEALAFGVLAAAFERIAGRVYIKSSNVLLQKKREKV